MGGAIGLGLGIEEEEGTRLAVRRIGVCPVNWPPWSALPTDSAVDRPALCSIGLGAGMGQPTGQQLNRSTPR